MPTLCRLSSDVMIQRRRLRRRPSRAFLAGESHDTRRQTTRPEHAVGLSGSVQGWKSTANLTFGDVFAAEGRPRVATQKVYKMLDYELFPRPLNPISESRKEYVGKVPCFFYPPDLNKKCMFFIVPKAAHNRAFDSPANARAPKGSRAPKNLSVP